MPYRNLSICPNMMTHISIFMERIFVMIGILSFGVLFAIVLYAVYAYAVEKELTRAKIGDKNIAFILLISLLAFVLRCILATKYMGHATDMNCFMAWSRMIFEDGIGNFYASDAFTDYPPGYMYVLYVIGAIEHLFNFSDGLYWLLVKLPAIICDIASGLIIYRIASKKFGDLSSALLAGIYLFNPTAVVNSSLWGQVDAVYTLFIVVMLYMLTRKELIKAYFVFALCVFIKPQAFIFTPLIIYAIIENVFLGGFDPKVFFKNLIGGLCAIALMFVLSLPFGLSNVIEQYKATLASYPYLTVNAFNVWGALGKNWSQLTTFTSVLGYVLLVLIVAYSAYVFFKTDKSNDSRYYFVGAVLSFSTYMLSTKMHDRYAFPAMILFLLAFIVCSSPRSFLLYAASALLQYFNTAWVLFIYEQDINKYFQSPVIVIASIINIVLFVYMLTISHKYYICNLVPVNQKAQNAKAGKRTAKSSASKVEPKAEKNPFVLSEHFPKPAKADCIAVVILMAVYSAIALYHLGNTYAPQTYTDIGTSHGIMVDLGKEYDVEKLKIYLGPYQLNEDDRILNIKYLDNDKKEVSSESVTSGSVFYWNEQEADVTCRFINLSTNAEHLVIMELGIYSDGSLISVPKSDNDSIEKIFDEQSMVPERSTYMNGTYFDEIYHGRTAYEFIHHLPVYEWTHPPLGKIFISLGIRLFGMTPFGWRIVGTVFGILMIPIIYAFAGQLLKKRWLTVLTTILLTFDFMHFAQTRIATIDVYVTFFIMLMYYFMYRYSRMSFNDKPLAKTLVPLALSGVCMGLGIASKWTGIYAGCGLAVIFFITLYKRYREYLYAQKHPHETSENISHDAVVGSFKKNVSVTLGCCVVFFIIVPLIIYVLSYIPYLQVPGSQGLKTIIDNQNSMFTYHSKTVVESTHPFSSHWYEWLIMKRPIWYYSGTISSEVKEGISSFGNPLVWWLGLAAFGYMVYLIFKKRDKTALFLVIAYLAQLLPWMAVTRTTYIYHYFPCVPFLVLMLGYSMKCIYDAASPDKPFELFVSQGRGALIRISSQRRAAAILFVIYAGLVIALFALFYPVLSGAPCSVWFADHFLKWFNTWVLL